MKEKRYTLITHWHVCGMGFCFERKITGTEEAEKAYKVACDNPHNELVELKSVSKQKTYKTFER